MEWLRLIFVAKLCLGPIDSNVKKKKKKKIVPGGDGQQFYFFFLHSGGIKEGMEYSPDQHLAYISEPDSLVSHFAWSPLSPLYHEEDELLLH